MILKPPTHLGTSLDYGYTYLSMTTSKYIEVAWRPKTPPKGFIIPLAASVRREGNGDGLSGGFGFMGSSYKNQHDKAVV